jgi:hypothetical protein
MAIGFLLNVCSLTRIKNQLSHETALRALSLSETQFGWHVKSNRAMLLVNERRLQPDLVGVDRIRVMNIVGTKPLMAAIAA